MSKQELLTTGQAAQVIGVTRRRVRQLIEEAKLPAAKLGRDYLITRKDAESFVRLPPGRVPSATPPDQTKKRGIARDTAASQKECHAHG